MAEPALLSPEIEGLLRELAADPRSELLRVPRPSSVESFFAMETPIGATQAGLLPGERELLRVHREELARLLREATAARLFATASGACHLVRFQTPTRRREWSRPAWETRVARALGSENGGDVALRALIGADVSSWPPALNLARLSHTIVPSDSARILSGIALVLDDEPRTALHLLDTVADRRRRGPLGANVWINLGLAYASIGDPVSAATANERSARLGEPSGTAAMNWLYNALVIGNETSIRSAAEWLGESVPGDSAALDDYVNDQSLRARSTPPERSAVAKRWIRKSSDLWPLSARRVASVLDS
jgi:hypothetical protein